MLLLLLVLLLLLLLLQLSLLILLLLLCFTNNTTIFLMTFFSVRPFICVPIHTYICLYVSCLPFNSHFKDEQIKQSACVYLSIEQKIYRLSDMILMRIYYYSYLHRRGLPFQKLKAQHFWFSNLNRSIEIEIETTLFEKYNNLYRLTEIKLHNINI